MKPLRVVWRPDQIYPYESVWGLLHKLCRWNRIHFGDVWDLVAVGRRALGAEVPTRRRDCSLIDPTWLDRTEFAQLLNLSITSTHDAFLDRYVCVSGLEDVTLWGVSGLRFCPKCLAKGFHSPLHHLPFLEECPIHRCALLNACPKCARSIRYSAPAADAFCCPCGHPLWDGRSSCSLGFGKEDALRETVRWIDLLTKGSFGPINKRRDEPDAPFAHSEAVIAEIFEVYQALRDQIKVALRVCIAQTNSSRTRCRDRVIPRLLVAFFAWRHFWERRPGTKGAKVQDVSAAVHARVHAIFPVESELVGTSLMRKLIKGAAVGTFTELWDLASGSERYGRAAYLGNRLTGAYIPLWTAKPKGRWSASHQGRGKREGSIPLNLEEIVDADIAVS